MQLSLEDFSRSCLTLVQTYYEGKCTKSDAMNQLTELVIDEIELASRAGDDVKKFVNEFDKARARARVEMAKGNLITLIPFGKPDSVKVPDDLRVTHKLRDNYARDPAYAKAILLRDPSRPEFPSNLWGNILANTFTDFDGIFSQIFRLVERKIEGFRDWSYTWDRYERAVLFAFPHRGLELQQYKKHIEDIFLAKRQGTKSMLQYDHRVRTRVAKSGSLRLCDFSEFSSDYLFLLVNGGY